MMKNQSKITKSTFNHIQNDSNKENQDNNSNTQNPKLQARSQKISSLTQNKDIHAPPKAIRRDQRPSLLQQVLSKKLKVNLGTSNIDLNILQVNSRRNSSRVDLTLISQLSRHPHYLSKNQEITTDQLKQI